VRGIFAFFVLFVATSADTLRDAMNAKEALAQLQALGDEKLRAQMMKRGAPAE